MNDRLATIPSYDVSKVTARILELTTQRENLRELLADIEMDPGYRSLHPDVKLRLSNLLEST
jgi:hypothetical protein